MVTSRSTIGHKPQQYKISTIQQKQAAAQSETSRNITKLAQHNKISTTQQKQAATQQKQAATQQKQVATLQKQATT